MRGLPLAVVLVLSACSLHREPPPPPPPPPPGASRPPETAAASPTRPVVTQPMAPVASGVPSASAVPVASGVPAPSGVPSATTTPPPTSAVPHLSTMCTRAYRCCSMLARYAPIRGAAARCAQLQRARDSDCSRAISEFAEAILEQGERPPEMCTQPGRH